MFKVIFSVLVVFSCAEAALVASTQRRFCKEHGLSLLRSSQMDVHDDENSLVYNGENEIMLGVVIPITTKKNGNKFCKVEETAGLQTLEAALYALDSLNKTDLPFTLGAIALDTCNDPSLAFENAVKLILPNYEFRQNLISCGNGTAPKKNNVREAYWKIIGIIGSENTEESLQVTYISEMEMFPQISNLATSAFFSNKNVYPSFMRTVPSDRNIVDALIEVLIFFDWTYISAIYDTSIYSIQGFANFENQAKAAGICFAVKEQLIDRDSKLTSTSINLIGSSQAKVVVIFASLKMAGQLLEKACQMKESSLIWLMIDTLNGRSAVDIRNCDIYKRVLAVVPRIQVLNGFNERFLQYRPSDCVSCNPWFADYFASKCNCSYNTNRKTSTQVNCATLEDGECARTLKKRYRQDPYLIFMTEAVYAYAEMLKQTYLEFQCPYPRNFSEKLCAEMEPRNLNFRSRKMIEKLRAISFKNINGVDFRFQNGIDGPPIYSIVFYSNATDWTIAGEYDGTTGPKDTPRLTFNNNAGVQPKLDFFQSLYSRCSPPCSLYQATKYFNPLSKCCWTCENCSVQSFVNRSIVGGSEFCEDCPRGTYPNNERKGCNSYSDQTGKSLAPLVPIIITFSTVGLIVTLAVSVVFWYYRETPVIRASDLYSSTLLLGGCLAAFTAPFLLIVTPSVATCSAVRVMIGVSEILIFATIFAKSMRIMFIFTGGAKSNMPRVMKHRFGVAYIVLIFLGVELFILILWAIMEPPHASPEYDVRENTFEYVCSTIELHYLIVYALPIALATPSVYFGFRIRKAPNGFNEGRAVSYLVYTNGLLLISLMPLLVSDFLDTSQAVLSLSLLVQSTGVATLSLLFFPKLYIVLIRPEKNTRQAVMRRSRTFSAETDDESKRRCSTCSYAEGSYHADSILHQVSPKRNSTVTHPREHLQMSNYNRREVLEYSVTTSNPRVNNHRSYSLSSLSTSTPHPVVSRSRSSTANAACQQNLDRLSSVTQSSNISAIGLETYN